jgi:hypothetical protein
MSKFLIFGLIIIFACKGEEANPLVDKVIGRYEGFINYFGSHPIPGDNQVEKIDFNVTREGENKIKITTSFDLELPVTAIFTRDASGDEIISLGAGQDVTYTSNGIEIISGGTDFNSWGEMCGYYNVTKKDLTIAFAWSKKTIRAEVFSSPLRRINWSKGDNETHCSQQNV